MKNCAAAAPASWSIHDLKPSERLVLWSLRYWTACKRQSKPCGDLLREVYANNGMPGAASQLDALMDLVNATARTPPGIRCTACPLLSADERAILDAVASAAERRLKATGDILERWLPPQCVRIALVMIENFALTITNPDTRQSSA
jgi:hypothetical protein